jgi:hypothetical protein
MIGQLRHERAFNQRFLHGNSRLGWSLWRPVREGVVPDGVVLLVIEGDVSINEAANHECQGCNLKMTNAVAFGIVPVLMVPSLSNNAFDL